MLLHVSPPTGSPLLQLTFCSACQPTPAPLMTATGASNGGHLGDTLEGEPEPVRLVRPPSGSSVSLQGSSKGRFCSYCWADACMHAQGAVE
jgi:hypothetical protein